MVGIFHSASTGTTTKIFVTDFDATHVIDSATITTALIATANITTTTLAASAVTGSKIDSATVAIANLTTSAYPLVMFGSETNTAVTSTATRYYSLYLPDANATESSSQITIPFAWAVTGLTVHVASNTTNATTDMTLRASSTSVSGTTTSIASAAVGEVSNFGISANVASSSKITLAFTGNGTGTFTPRLFVIYGIRT